MHLFIHLAAQQIFIGANNMPDSMGMPESNKKYVASHSHSRREVHVHYGELNVLTGCSECCGKTPKFHPRKTLPLTQTRFQSPWSTSSRRQRARPWIQRTPVSQRGLGEAQARWRVRRPGHPRGEDAGHGWAAHLSPLSLRGENASNLSSLASDSLQSHLAA